MSSQCHFESVVLVGSAWNVNGGGLSISGVSPYRVSNSSKANPFKGVIGGFFSMTNSLFHKNEIDYHCLTLGGLSGGSISENGVDVVVHGGSASIIDIWSVVINNTQWYQSELSAMPSTPQDVWANGAAISIWTTFRFSISSALSSPIVRNNSWLASNVQFSNCRFVSSVLRASSAGGTATGRGVDIFMESTTIVPRYVTIQNTSFQQSGGWTVSSFAGVIQGSVLVVMLEGGDARLASPKPGQQWTSIRIENVLFQRIGWSIIAPTCNPCSFPLHISVHFHCSLSLYDVCVAPSCTIGAYGELVSGYSDDRGLFTTTINNVTIDHVHLVPPVDTQV
jgi:hypothetical protein